MAVIRITHDQLRLPCMHLPNVPCRQNSQENLNTMNSIKMTMTYAKKKMK